MDAEYCLHCGHKRELHDSGLDCLAEVTPGEDCDCQFFMDD